MAQHSLSAKKIAIMVSAGFDEAQFIDIQKSMMANHGWLKVVANKPGLVNGARDGMLGMAYPVDATIAETLAIDYDGLVIPGGEKHIATLSEEPHALRILRAFLRESMPVLLIEEAATMLDHIESDVTSSDFDASQAIDCQASIARAQKDASMTSSLAALAEIMHSQEEEQAA